MILNIQNLFSIEPLREYHFNKLFEFYIHRKKLLFHKIEEAPFIEDFDVHFYHTPMFVDNGILKKVDSCVFDPRKK